jgi:hypothetical protein
MSIKYYRYPRSIQVTKAISKILCFVVPSLFLLLIIINWANPTQSYANYPGLIFGAILFAFLTIYFIYSWPEIGVSEEGLLIEFLWFKLNVPWTKLLDIEQLPTPFVRIWLVKTNDLTIFHRLYGLLNGPSIKPSGSIVIKVAIQVM